MSATAATTQESTVWQGTPSQLINFSQYLGWGVIFFALLAAGVAILGSLDHVPAAAVGALCVLVAIPWAVIGWKWLVLAHTRYELTTQRLRIRTGVLNRRLEEVELYRVRDYKLEQPFFQRLFSLSTV